MRLGVIDVGSNTVHFLVVDAHLGGHPLPAFSHKIELRLSESIGPDGRVDKRCEQRLVSFVAECRRLADDNGVEDIFGFATSALREAGNGEGILERVRAETGTTLEVLSGPDEARMTFLAVRRWFGWSSGRLLVIDIGGGSLELASGIDEEPDVALSLPLGAGRVTRERLPGDPPDKATVKQVRSQVRAEVAAQVRPLLKAGVPDRVVGTSKTIRSLARLAGAAPSAEGPFVHRSLRREDLTEIVGRVRTMSAAERARLPGVSVTRAPQLLGGALVVEAAMDLLRVDQLDICPWALREGLILRRLDHIAS
ncbi:MAG TPA: Ppx/GppA phosphatase family protein [Intrasporangium sp.]|uniref:Ppx/GppA phosphatase family protein n=1 Tax=Intrasporangium sp. TaxID=1925024 RepID=UPI002D7731DB|nr:Ppx/GppA phosphatase family protein [Intrasporangium sp.]HET7398888.1 Ppx/GppA phosphatase family protein [Intrasporangium sp.]